MQKTPMTIRQLRLAKGWSQAHLAALVGVTPAAAFRWESGISMPTVPKFRRIARALGVSMEHIVLAGEPGAEQRVPGVKVTRKRTTGAGRRAVA